MQEKTTGKQKITRKPIKGCIRNHGQWIIYTSPKVVSVTEAVSHVMGLARQVDGSTVGVSQHIVEICARVEWQQSGYNALKNVIRGARIIESKVAFA